MTDRVEVRGGARLQRTMRAAGRDLADLTDANKRAAEIAVPAAKSRMPVRTGRTRASVRADGYPSEARLTAGGAAPFIEHGVPSRGIAANPVLRDALTTTEPQWLDVYLDAVDHALDHVKGI